MYIDCLVNEDIIALQRIYQPKDAHSIAVRVFLLSNYISIFYILVYI